MRLLMPADTEQQPSLEKEKVDGRLVIFVGGRVIVDSHQAFVSQGLGVGRTWIVPVGDVRIWRLQRATHAKRSRDAFGLRIPLDLVISSESVECVAWAYEKGDGPADHDDFLFFSEDNLRATVLPVQGTATGPIR